MKLAWIQILLSLIIGFALGLTFDRWNICNCHCPCLIKHFQHGNLQCKMIERLNSELQLTSEQKAKVAEIFKAKRGEMQKIKAEIRPKFEALRKSTNAEMKKFLTSEQQKKLDALDAKMESMHKKMHEAFSKD